MLKCAKRKLFRAIKTKIKVLKGSRGKLSRALKQNQGVEKCYGIHSNKTEGMFLKCAKGIYLKQQGDIRVLKSCLKKSI